MSTTPKWVTNLITEVCERAGAKPPLVVWRRSKVNLYSCGRYWRENHRIVVTAGTSHQDHRLVLLHELAHALTPQCGHSVRFWETAWRLYRIHRVPLAYARKREFAYMKKAEPVYRRIARESQAESLRLLAGAIPSGVGLLHGCF